MNEFLVLSENMIVLFCTSDIIATDYIALLDIDEKAHWIYINIIIIYIVNNYVIVYVDYLIYWFFLL